MSFAGTPAGGIVLNHDAYVWQRLWTPSLRSALRQAADWVSGWRVLAAQADADGHLHEIDIDAALLIAIAKPTLLVIRIDAALARISSRRP